MKNQNKPMTEAEIIKAWKENEKPFGLLPKEMRDWALKHTFNPFEYFADIEGCGGWVPVHPRIGFIESGTFRLRQDYEVSEPIKPKQKYVSVESLKVRTKDGYYQHINFSDAVNDLLLEILNK